MLQKDTSWSFNHKFNLKNPKNPFENHPRFEGGLVISVLSLFTVFTLCVIWTLSPAKLGSRTTRIFEVKYGESLRDVSQSLEKQGIIRYKTAYEFYVRLNLRRRMAKAGHYRVGPGMSVPGIVGELVRGKPQANRVTIPEGLTLKQTASLLAGKGIVNEAEFLRLASDSNFVTQAFTALHVENGAEGYLFPNTYDFDIKMTTKEVITIMLRLFEKEYLENFAQVPNERLEEIVTLASVIEKEAKRAEERPVIAGVFYNRLQRNIPLQSCATVQYALGKHKARLYYKDVQIKSPYNTYIHPGLPPGPIANPGLASLKAAVSPQEVPYLYFVAKSDGSHAFSATYKEHIQIQSRMSHEDKANQPPAMKPLNSGER